MINGQKVEECIEQIINSNVQPKIYFKIQPIPFENDPEKCIIVIYVPINIRAPHMVTYKGDNRYYRRYFIRHQYQVLPAEEYEVRELLERSQRMTKK